MHVHGGIKLIIRITHIMQNIMEWTHHATITTALILAALGNLIQQEAGLIVPILFRNV